MENFGIGMPFAQGGMPFSMLSSEQSEKAKEIIANYDADNATDEEKQEMIDALKEAGIQPGPQLGKMLMEAGFDPMEMRSIAQQSNGNMGPPLNLDMDVIKQGQSAAQQDFMTLLSLLRDSAEDEDAQSALDSFLEQLSQRYTGAGMLLDEEQ